MEYIENRTFDEIELGDTASLIRTLSQEDIELFAVMSGDVNPAHLDLEYARSDMFHKIIAHGMWGGSLISTLLGTKLPGPGTIYLGQTLKFKRPVALGDTITVTITAVVKDVQRNGITFDCTCVNQKGEVVISGSADVIAPTERVKRPRVILPEVFLYEHGARYRNLIEAAAKLDPVTVAVVNPLEPAFLASIVEATQKNIIKPIIIGPVTKIREAAEFASIDITQFNIREAEYGLMSAIEAVRLARTGEVEALVKGNLPYEDMMKAVNAPDTGLATYYRMSHVFIMDVPTYPRPLFLTDAVLNIYPDLDTKRDIVQNAIDLAHVVGLENPKVAILSAVTTVNAQIKSTLDAAALCKMVDRGQITGGIVDGPLSFDTAISLQAARERGIVSPVAGLADVLVVPDLESGNILARQLEYLAEAQGVGVVLGARVPIMLAIHADSSITHLASYALASLLAHKRRTTTP
ncbi:MAG: bifunctional enoyl-CoA hydratase/phosphate acetyltransferase [Chloroflexi bacterium]|uniref:Bifunctional enoyl-CoA hydratase/phosphate acetyltransferase n=1 Tax=Candidatus Chlorohelix allophototropha TaxID=3003348 RepID=A0A8T7M591_9CHLR|nr:bifunctional enoyl-CoA hydratase/phosphate acetyltransferase [Chloroflexota bacterium]WJW69183.1 bifunctional enoyl-CoA hydratase/phosphate acetyltransferase [Chloroflexota bacterium L227-S17]